MGTRDPRIDAYIAKSAPFAQPILEHIRAAVHQACPKVEETIKWRFPYFVHHGPLCGMAAFKAHCGLSFWKGALVLGEQAEGEGIGQFGRIQSLQDLPAKKTLLMLIKRATALNEEGIKAPAKPKSAPKIIDVPPDFAAVLRKNRRAAANFEALSPSCRREYLEWITSAKRDETRAKRMATAVEWITEGKSRNWKYENC